MCINVCIIKMLVPRAHEVKNQRVIAIWLQMNCSSFPIFDYVALQCIYKR